MTNQTPHRPTPRASRRGISDRPGRAALVAGFGLVAGLVLGIVPAAATTVVLLDDAVLLERADLVVTGRIEAVDRSAGLDRPETVYQVAIDEVVKGGAPGSRIELSVGVGVLPDGHELVLHGAPSFEPDGAALLFLRETADGRYRAVEFLQGAFHVVEAAGRRYALRDLDEVRVLGLDGRAAAGDPVRDLDLFVEWMRDREAGLDAPREYAVSEPPPTLAPRFTFITQGGLPVRWQTFDSGGNQRFRAHESGQPGLSGGGFSQFATALAAWSADPDTPVDYRYNGTIGGSPGGLTSPDGQNTILWDDPNDNPNFDGHFACSTGGTLAIGGPWVSTGGSHAQPLTGVAHRQIVEADIVTNSGIGCWIPPAGRAEELFAHELGHTLGLGHSTASGALMRATAYGDGRGAAIASDDRAGLCQLYCLSNPGGGAPAAPSNLSANAESPTRVRLFWSDNSSNETGFEVERSTGGNFTRIATAGAGAISYLDQAVVPQTGYTYRVRAVGDGGASSYSNQASATTPAATGLIAPSNLVATAQSSTRIDLTWADNATTETGYEIQMALGSGSFATVATTGANVTSRSITGLQSATTYSFRVRATGAEGSSAFSNTATAATFGDTSPCVANSTTMCLNGDRFRVRVNWRSADESGTGRVIETESADSGLFWFFQAANWELLVKVLNGCGVNSRFWVLSAATTDVEYTLTVTDTATGAVRTYTNQLGVASPANADTQAFATCSVQPSTAEPENSGIGELAAALADPLLESFRADRAGDPDLAPRTCSGGAQNLCLAGSRFRVTVEWENFEGGSGPGRVVPFGTTDSGLFWFFDPNNWEMMVKVLNACGVNGQYWVFSAATTNVEYTLRVTDTDTGSTRTYFNPLGNLADALARTSDFPCN